MPLQDGKLYPHQYRALYIHAPIPHIIPPRPFEICSCSRPSLQPFPNSEKKKQFTTRAAENSIFLAVPDHEPQRIKFVYSVKPDYEHRTLQDPLSPINVPTD